MTGHIFQEEEGNGIPKEQNVGKIEGGGSAGDARPDWTTRTWAKLVTNLAKACIIWMVHMAGVWELAMNRLSTT